MTPSLQRQLTIRVLLATLALSAATGAGLYAYARSALTREFDATSNGKARAFGSLVELEPGGTLEVEFSAASLPEYYAPKPERFFELRNEAGTIVAGSPGFAERNLLPPGVPLTQQTGFDVELPNGRRGRGICFPIHPWPEPAQETDGARSPDGAEPAVESYTPGFATHLMANSKHFTLVLVRDRADLDRTLRLLLTGLLLAGVTLAGATTLAVALIVRRSLRPVQIVADEAGHIDANSLDRRLPVDGLAIELRPICQCINELLDRVEAGFKRERQFTANVAHELRTPIAELRAMAEVALQRSSLHGTSPAQNDTDALDIALQMEAIVTTLLALARCHAGTEVAQPSRVDLGEAVAASWRKFARRAESRGLRASVDTSAGTMVQTDRGLLAPVFDNLFSNAVEYTPRGGDVRCSFARAGDRITLTVANATAGLGAEDLPRLCEPFWRKDAARCASSHSGLGLALVEAYAKLLGIELKLGLSADNEISVALIFPVASDPPDATPHPRPPGPATRRPLTSAIRENP